jgi:hypothetical protein
VADAAQPSAPAEAASQVLERIVVAWTAPTDRLTALSWALRVARLRGASVHAVMGWSDRQNWPYSLSGSMFPPGYSPTGGMMPSASEPSMPALTERAQSAEADAALAAVENVLDAAVNHAVEQNTGSHQASATPSSAPRR